MSESEAERAWLKWAAERDEIDKRFVSYVVKDAFLAGFEAGAEAYLKFLKNAKQEEP